MKRLINLLGIIFLFNSCVELPDLIPNGSGEASDMVVIEYNSTLNSITNGEMLEVDELLNFRFYFDGTGCSGESKMKVINGQILKQNLGNGSLVYLNEGDLLGGFIGGGWSNELTISSTQDFFLNCLTTYKIAADVDVIAGIRFKDADNKWHYGWIVFYLDTSTGIRKLYVKATAYNKKAGVNVRIGG